MEFIFWVVLILGSAGTLSRVPGLSKSRNHAIFLCALCTSIAFGLMIPGVYTSIDQLFERTNFTDLFAKLALLLAANILVCEIARTLRNPRAMRLTAGISGKTILVITFFLEMALFAFTHTPEASPGLGLYINDPLVLAYNSVIVLYIGYLAALLLGPLVTDARNHPIAFRRTASGLLAAGFGLMILRAVLMLVGFVAMTGVETTSLYEFGQLVSGLSAIFIVSGFVTAWLALRKYGTPKITQSVLRVD